VNYHYAINLGAYFFSAVNLTAAGSETGLIRDERLQSQDMAVITDPLSDKVYQEIR
jgi:hypothetical protein